MVPTFNCASYLSATLASVLAQDPGPEAMQIEVIDDASDRDDPEAVVNEIACGRVGFFRQPRNLGLIRNFTTSLQRARGEIVHLLHGDDLVLPGFYAALEKGFAADAEIGAAFCRWTLIDETGRNTDTAKPEQDYAGRLPDALARLASEQRIVTPAIAVRRSVWETLGGFDPRLRCSEDWEMWVRIAAHFPIWYDPAPLAAYRVRANSNTGRNFRMAEELRYTAMAIDIFRPLLPPERAGAITTAARLAYARSALSNAQLFASQGDRAAMLAHLTAAVRLSRAPHVLRRAILVALGRSRDAGVDDAIRRG